MPIRAPRTCKRPGCWYTATHGRYCDEHKRYDEQLEQSYRDSNPLRVLYQTAKWKVCRAIVLARDPICVECKRAAATQADHKERAQTIARLYGIAEFFNPARCQGLCKSCHSRKTALEVGYAGAH
jgi:5-methylcytosine-specific restriction enzyme A